MERKWVLIDPVTAVCYIRNASLVGRGPRRWTQTLRFDVETLPWNTCIEEQHDHHIWHKTWSSCCVCWGATSAFRL